ncbi:MAG: hypothetical protein O3B01_25110 [Planctomycetota bacterium]|nr:hypothetical protein [Planctomycetota bacterium]
MTKSSFLPVLILFQSWTFAEDFQQIVNSQNPEDVVISPSDAMSKMVLPEGFKVTLFAAEPHVRQPIAFELDDRGRLWVAECYSYARQGYLENVHDRIIILEDLDADGRFDRQKVFWDSGYQLTGLAYGFGGIWALIEGRLLFFADKDGDDQPDGDPAVHLDGFNTKDTMHNIVNGMLWGPDGWLYGRHGIQGTSRVGPPGTPDEQRVPLNCSIWRYHPTLKKFEVVTHGTTNPWGLDYDEHGQMFFTNNVIGHLWHVIPGASYQRMYGQDFNPYAFGLIEQSADHYHWDSEKKWTDSRTAEGKHGELGGGHSHCGGMIYLGDNWPDQYRGRIFMGNTHGRRINQDRLERQGTSYAGKHEPDFMMANQPWFLGVEMEYGPDGAVYLSDWVDLGECHGRDGIHRTSGRIYRITYGDPKPVKMDVSKADDMTLLSLLKHKNEWFIRRARRLLQERAVSGNLTLEVAPALIRMLESEKDVRYRLRALWALHSIGKGNSELLLHLLDDKEEHLRAWAIKLLMEEENGSEEAATSFATLARSETSGLVRLHLASALQRLPFEKRWAIAAGLASHAEDADDRCQPLMIWYGIEPAILPSPKQALELARTSCIPLLRQYIARRLAAERK